MAQVILTDAYVKLDDTEYSGQNTNVAISYSADAVDNTAMGDDTSINVGGVKSWAVELEFIQDETVSGQTFFDMVGTVVAIEVRPTSALASPANPSYQGNGLLTDYAPLGGAHGDLVKATLSFVSAGPLTRVTA